MRDKGILDYLEMKGPTLSLGGRGVFIVTNKKPTPGLWIRYRVGKDPSFLHDVT